MDNTDELKNSLDFYESAVKTKINAMSELRKIASSSIQQKELIRLSVELRRTLSNYMKIMKELYHREPTKTSFPKGYNPHAKEKDIVMSNLGEEQKGMSAGMTAMKMLEEQAKDLIESPKDRLARIRKERGL